MVVDLKKIRIDKKLTQVEFAAMIDIGQAYLSELENGRRDISNEVFNKLIKTFGEDVIDQYTMDVSNVSSVEKQSPIGSDTYRLVPQVNLDAVGGYAQYERDNASKY